ncbi:MAG: FGGY family carbohydrate kinase [Gammaproteobacteria bacterium]|nr:FGGY family carbohydrate kinase [Gammaproteobacteria bacterium]
MNRYTLAIDAGTTNLLAMVLDESGQVKGKASGSYQLSYPAPGLVELDPESLWQSVLDTVKTALSISGIAAKDLAGVGITGQRTTIVIWERDSGKTLGPAVVWQDQRGKQRADELLEQGFITSNSLSAMSKMEQVLGSLPNGYARVKNNELAWGNVDSFLAWRLSGGAIHATDASNASATGYFDFFADWKWFDGLLEIQNLPSSFFPEIVDSVGIMGHTDPKLFGAKIPIGAIIGDQQSALYGQACLEPGMAKISFGTSGTCDVNSGGELKLATGAYPSVAWTRDGEKTFLVEGMVITAGAVFGWLTQLGILDSPSQASLLGENTGANGVSFLPALQGLGTPHNNYDRFGAFEGLTLSTSKRHIVGAAIEGVAFRVREMVDQIYLDSELPRPDNLRVDGGATENDLLMQLQANVLGCAIERMDPTEATAYGVALLAGEACGIWEPDSSARLHRVDKTFEPQWSESEREERFEHWKSVFGL